ncbi:MAG: hypothetical protein WCX46_02905 [Candidatus Paceibacterota bacterium]
MRKIKISAYVSSFFVFLMILVDCEIIPNLLGELTTDYLFFCSFFSAFVFSVFLIKEIYKKKKKQEPIY